MLIFVLLIVVGLLLYLLAKPEQGRLAEVGRITFALALAAALLSLVLHGGPSLRLG